MDMYTRFIMKDINNKWAIHPIPKGSGLLAGQAKMIRLVELHGDCMTILKSQGNPSIYPDNSTTVMKTKT
jgi:hypothetical protein